MGPSDPVRDCSGTGLAQERTRVPRADGSPIPVLVSLSWLGTTDIPWHLGTRPIRAEDPPESTAGVEWTKKFQKKKSGSNKSEKCQAKKRWVTLMCCQLRQFIRCITKPLPSSHLPPSSHVCVFALSDHTRVLTLLAGSKKSPAAQWKFDGGDNEEPT